ncbi:MAG: hypothetical protein JO246_02920, partial [Frankiaceae bacterium]|nr:hypothetical protein [Frankiaceae bacterium]
DQPSDQELVLSAAGLAATGVRHQIATLLATGDEFRAVEQVGALRLAAVVAARGRRRLAARRQGEVNAD